MNTAGKRRFSNTGRNSNLAVWAGTVLYYTILRTCHRYTNTVSNPKIIEFGTALVRRWYRFGYKRNMTNPYPYNNFSIY